MGNKRRRDLSRDARLGIQDDAVPGVEPTYHCRRCDEHYAGLQAAEDHLVVVHSLARDLAREAIIVSARG